MSNVFARSNKLSEELLIVYCLRKIECMRIESGMCLGKNAEKKDIWAGANRDKTTGTLSGKTSLNVRPRVSPLSFKRSHHCLTHDSYSGIWKLLADVVIVTN